MVDLDAMDADPWPTWPVDKNELRGLVHEIERLRAALRKICDGPRDADKSYAELFAEVSWEARAALAGEKTDA
jgi:hypothetical protein